MFSEKLRGLDVERYTIDDLIELRAGARMLEVEYRLCNYEVPEWLRDREGILDTEIARQRTDALRKRLRELDAAEAALKTADERRSDVKAERERLLAELQGSKV